MNIYILTEEWNEYDQHGAYFLAAFVDMPSARDIRVVMAREDTPMPESEIAHILKGGGRQKTESVWYHLRVYDTTTQAYADGRGLR